MASKQVKKKEGKSLYLYLFQYIKKHHALPTHKFSKQKLNYYVKQLKNANLIERIGYSSWEITGHFEEFKTSKEVKEMDEFGSLQTNITRGHGFKFKILLPKREGWHYRTALLDAKNINYKSIHQGQSFQFGGHTIWLSNLTMTIWFRRKLSYISADSYECSARALMECKNTIKALERALDISFKRGNGWAITEEGSHYADINNAVAIDYHRRGINQVNIQEFGKTWAIIDNSFDLHELEAVAPNGKSKDDIKILQNFLNDLKTNPITLTRMKEDFETEIKQTLSLMEYQTKAIAELQKQNIMLTDIIQRKL